MTSQKANIEGVIPAASLSRSLDTWFARLLLFVWIGVALVTIYITIFGAPLRFHELRMTSPTVWATGAVNYVDQQLSAQEEALLVRAGLTSADYAAYIVALEILVTLVLFVPSILIVWQRSNEWLAVMIAISLACLGLTEPAIDSAIGVVQPFWLEPLEIMQAFGLLVAFALTFFVFPDGRFTPRWTRYAIVAAAAIMITWLRFPDLPYNPINGVSWERTPIQSALFTGALIGIGVFAQVQRYRNFATPLQRLQIQAGTFGFLMLFVAEMVRSFSYALVVPAADPGVITLAANTFRYPVFILLVLFLPLGFGMAILRYELWNLDLIIRQTALYSLLTAGVGLIYCLIIVLSSVFFNRFTELGTIWFTAASAIVATLLLLPIYRFVQRRIDRAYNRRWINFQAELTNFSHTVRMRLSVDDIINHLVDSVAQLMQCDITALALPTQDHVWRLATSRGASLEQSDFSNWIGASIVRLRRGESVAMDGDLPVHLLVPLMAQRADQPDLVAVLFCGARSMGQPYDRTAAALLTGMADHASSALLVAELVASERWLEQQRNTPLGRAEILAARCEDDSSAQAAILALFEEAVDDTTAAQQLAHLPAVLRGRDQSRLGILAEGCHLIVNGRGEANEIIIGLQRIDLYLAGSESDSAEMRANRAIIAMCLEGLHCADLDSLDAVLAAVGAIGHEYSPPFAQTVKWLARLEPLRLALDKQRRSLNSDDRLDYLVDALGLCTELQSSATANDTSATLVIAPMLARWNQILVDAIRAEHARVAITLHPLTARVPAGRLTQLILQVKNEGRQQAERVVVALEPSKLIASAAPTVELGPLLPGQDAQLHIPITLSISGPFSVSFHVAVFDTEEHQADFVVALSFEALGNSAPFRPIPNPYIIGSPLRAESPLFVGRADALETMQAALTKRAEPTAVLLTGPKRMGKTSLIFRLAGILGEGCVPVYIDLQGVGYEVGIGNFLLDIAIEIARELDLPISQTAIIQEQPRHFSQVFLPQVRQALGARRLVLLMDEFEEIDQRVQDGLVGRDVYAYLRHLVQHEEQIAWFFAGTNRLSALPTSDSLSLFANAEHRTIGLLGAANARRLITEPVQGFLEYDDLAVDKMMRLTEGHPYFLQVICHAVVMDANHNRRVLVTSDEVNAAVNRTLEMSEAHLLALWREMSADERDVASAIATLGERGGYVRKAAIVDLLPPEKQQNLDTTLAALVRRGTLAGDEQNYSFRFILELQRQWVVTRPQR